jgi:type IV pilus assembly protein PilC
MAGLKTYQWQGYNHESQSLSGELQAGDKSTVRTRLLRDGVIVTSVQKVRSETSSVKAPHKRLMLDALEQLASLLTAGLPLTQALEIITGASSDRNLRKLLHSIHQQISRGATLAEAMRQHPAGFQALTINLISIGEASGKLEQMLARVCAMQRQQMHTRALLLRALQYPIIVLTVAISVIWLMLTRIVPAFVSNYESLDAELPALTQSVMQLAQLVKTQAAGVLSVAILISVTLMTIQRRSMRAGLWTDRHLLSLPVVGNILQAGTLHRICFTLATTMQSGLNLLSCLQSAAKACGNRHYSRQLLAIARQIEKGDSLYQAVRTTGSFPVMIEQMVKAGEESGTLENMLQKCAEHYRESMESSVKVLTSLLEPLLMTVLGLVIGVLMLAMYLPVFNLGSVL